MSALQMLYVGMLAINGASTIFAAICVDRAERSADGWYHGNASNWRIVAALNAVTFGLNGICLAVTP